MNSKSPSVFKNILRAGSGGVAVLVALFLMMFMKGGGDGDGETDEKPTTPGTDMVSVDTTGAAGTTDDTSESPNDEVKPDESESEAGGLTAEEKTALSDNVLGIMIDEYDYFMVIPGEVTIYRPTELDQLLALAQKAEGDSNGIRVRILNRKSSRMKAQVDLKKALADIGIGEDAVYMPKELLDD